MKLNCFFLSLLLGFNSFSLFSQTLNITPLGTLPSTLNETSGLEANGSNKIWTHNDSGGQNKIYEVDTLGNITRIVTILNANLVDWEEMTQDDQGNFYIGDFGNNGNARTNLKIYKIPNPDSLSSDSVNAEVINLSYADQPSFPPPNSRRHYDMEAMVWLGDSLYLFSKNRTVPFDGYTRLYKLPDTAGTYSISPVDSFYTGPGPKEAYWITGADLSPSGKQLIIHSYQKAWFFSCFTGNDFFGGDVQELDFSITKQYDGVKFIDETKVYFSNETTSAGAASLNKADISSFITVPFVNLGPDINTINPSAIISAGNLPSGTTYLWSDGTTNAQTTVSTSGTYWIEVSNGSCVETDTIIVNLLCENFGSTISGTDANCFGDASGTIDLTVVGGTAGYTYSWSNGDTTQDLSNIPAGTYTVSIIDTNNCITAQSQTIGEPSQIVLSTSADSTLCFADSSGSINLSVSGGTPTYSFAWSNGESTQNISNLPAGPYNVVVTDANNCPMTISDTVLNAPPIGIALNNTDPSCVNINDGAIDLSVAGGTPVFTYAWSTGDTTQDLTGLGTGTYSFSITDANGCVRTDSVTLSAPAAPDFALTGQDLLCAGDSSGAVNLSINSGATPFSYLWNNGDTTANINTLPAGTYQLTLTDLFGCVFTDSVSIGEPSPLTVANLSSTPDSTGSSGTISLSVSGGTPPYTYAWSNNATDSTLSGLAAGGYSVNITDANGCNIADSTIVEALIADAIEAPMGLQSFSLYPNPASLEVKLKIEWQFAQEASLRIFNLQGQLIGEEKLAASPSLERTISLEHLPAGMYLFELRTPNGIITKKVQKQ
ncbi:MAG: T9SS type A sorting domain-containing protein [Bacteroidota bacterium]